MTAQETVNHFEQTNAQGMTNFQVCISLALANQEKKILDKYIESLSTQQEKDKYLKSKYYVEISSLCKRFSKISDLILEVESSFKDELPNRILKEIQNG